MQRILTETRIRVLSMRKKDGSRWLWLYEPARKSDVLRSMWRFASNPELDFTRYDAEVLAQRLREQ